MTRRSELFAILAIVVVAACSVWPGPVIRIDDGVTRRMAPNDVAELVLERIHAMEATLGHTEKPARIISVTATTAGGVARLGPDAGRGDAPALGVQWVVRAEGTFINDRMPPGAEPMVATSGYFVISDLDGSVIGFGFP